MRKILKFLFVVQSKLEIDSFKRKRIVNRMNPYNPITYIVIVLTIITAILLFGFIGAWKEMDLRNPFEWI